MTDRPNLSQDDLRGKPLKTCTFIQMHFVIRHTVKVSQTEFLNSRVKPLIFTEHSDDRTQHVKLYR